MPRKTIAVDIDDVLAASASEFVAFGNLRWGTNLTVDDYHEDWSVMWQVDRETEQKRAHEIYDSGMIRGIKPHEGADAVLKWLEERYDLVIATSRVSKIHQDTLEWLDKHFGGVFKGVHLSGIYDPILSAPFKDESVHNMTKAELIMEIAADYLIDDQPKHCLAVADAGIETILFGDYAWSRDLGELPVRVTRCPDWAAVKEFFDGRD
ncbi:MAG TPA: hypothetical protein VLG27_00720 [Candidatus Saccharimonadia bacterium]|nr:hypothetical protein [Candidatus Saccharimonadia bacterium]